MMERRAGAVVAALLASVIAPCGAALEVRIAVGSITWEGLADPVLNASISCRLESDSRPVDAALCKNGRAGANWRDQTLEAGFSARLARTGAWELGLQQLRTQTLLIRGDLNGRGESLEARLNARISDLTVWPALMAALAPKWPKLDLAGSLDLDLSLKRRGAAGSAEGQLVAKGLTLAEPSGRYASDQLGARMGWNGTWSPQRADASIDIDARSGQAYAEPIFLDFTTAAASASARLALDRRDGSLEASAIRVQHTGVLDLSGRLSKAGTAAPDADLEIRSVQLGPAFTTYAQPFLAGTSFEKLGLSGSVAGHIVARAGQVHSLDLTLDRAGIDAPVFDAALSGLSGAIHWSDPAPPEKKPSHLHWTGGRIAKLDLGGSDLHVLAAGRDFTLQSPLRIPMADGALVVNQLALRKLGTPEVSAHFDAGIEPIDLATLTRALGWPEFGGRLGGRLPGLQFEDRELRLDGALRAQAFDGEISVDGLRAIDPLGRVPRVLANIHLRNLDLAKLTGAFSFGRIEGRLDGDVENLRVENWQPVAFDARLATPPGDRSRKRISQRAIDNISAIGGGPTGVLSRGALSIFEDFAYARIGWSCVLRDGVCRMDGVEPADDGGYVLVKGRLLPRIDVVGYQREVDWNTFLSQLRSASTADNVEVR
ncbi:MAG: hypothetical protein ACT4QA_13710 [Panacagrimonas sp.]